MKKNKLIGVIAASLMVGFSAIAQQNQPAAPNAQSSQGQQSQTQPGTRNQPPSPPSLNEPAGASPEAWDKDRFLKEVAKSGMAEVNMAQIGTQKAQDPALKEVAQKLVTDHSKLNDQIKELAQKKNITLSMEIDPKYQKMIDHLSSLSGSEFDKAFATHMVQGHKKSIAKFKQAAANTEDMEISQFAKETLPTLQQHLASIQKWAPHTTAGAAVEEPAGAESNEEDKSKEDSAAPDYKSPDSSKSETP